MKKITTLILSCLMVLGLFVACGSASTSSGGLTGPGASYTVGVIQLVEHPSLDEIRIAIEAEIARQAADLGIEVNIDYQNGQDDISIINSISRQMVNDGVDAIVAIATPTAQSAASTTSDIPIIFSAVTDPVDAGLVDDLNKPDGNITGTSDYIDVERIFALADELTPGVETYGFIYNKGESNSVSVINSAKEYLDSKNISYVEKTVVNGSDVQQAARALLEECDAVFAPIDNTVASVMGVLADEAITASKPVYVAADSMVADGGLATAGVNYTQLGTQTADMVMRVLTGTPVNEIPVEVLTDLAVTVNTETAEAVGVDVSKYAK